MLKDDAGQCVVAAMAPLKDQPPEHFGTDVTQSRMESGFKTSSCELLDNVKLSFPTAIKVSGETSTFCCTHSSPMP